MRKIITSALIAAALGLSNPAVAVSRTNYNPYNNYHSGYNHGYKDGKHDAYMNVGRTLVITGAVVIAGIIIYELGRDSRWTANEKGVVYRF